MPGFTAVKIWTLLPAATDPAEAKGKPADAFANPPDALAELADAIAECLKADTGMARLIVPVACCGCCCLTNSCWPILLEAGSCGLNNTCDGMETKCFCCISCWGLTIAMFDGGVCCCLYWLIGDLFTIIADLAGDMTGELEGEKATPPLLIAWLRSPIVFWEEDEPLNWTIFS